MAEAAISTVVELLGDLLIKKIKSLRGVEGKVELLKDELRRMQSFLRDANRKQFEDERVRNWISEIRELAQDAKDTIDMFLLNVERAKNRGPLRRCTTFSKRMYHLDKIADEIDSISARLEAIKTSRDTYGIEDLGQAAESSSRLQVESLRRLCPWQTDEHLVGVDDDVKKLLQKSILCKEKKGLSIAIVEGMGGIGKSTLARNIYNHPDVVGGSFDCRGWVVVSSEFTPQEMIKQLMFELPGYDKEKLHELEKSMKDKQYLLEKLEEMLYNQLEGKSYFIVLDDVWEKEHLESLISTAFPNHQDKASRLLVTTRNKILTKYDQYVHKMNLLDLKNGWDLMLKKALINGECPEELKGVGREILGKCHGLPLAINMVGSLLVGQQTKIGWEQVLNQINFYLGRAESSVSSILELSYQNLSPQLKACFLCLSFFKEDFIIPTKRLVNTWDAQGLIKQEGSRSIDEIGRGYLNELINRSMLQIQDLVYGDRVKSCRIHDLVREVCLRKAKEEIGLEMVKPGEEEISTESSRKARHRVVYGCSPVTSSLNHNKDLRSLFLLNIQGGHQLFLAIPWKSYQLLKTLELDGISLERFPNSFRFLIGLKCLRIHNCYLELKLPRWLDHLKSLEVLDMGKQGMVLFPFFLSLKMERLRYFRSEWILFRDTKINTWKNMESLKYMVIGDWMRYISNPTGDRRLRELGIRLDRCITNEELGKTRASLAEMQNLVTLQLKFFDFAPEIALAIPNHLAKLKLFGNLPKCPAASMFPPNLSHLTLVRSRLHDDPMAELGKLPKLSFLKFDYNSYLGETMQVLCDGFPCLEALSFQNLSGLKEIVIEEGGMPQLKHLRIRKCPKLETRNLPVHINISTQ